MASKTVRVVLGATVPLTVTTFLIGQAEYFAEQGLDVHVVCGDCTDFRSELVTFHSVHMTRNPNPLQDLGSLASWIRLLRDIRPDVVMVGTPKAGLLGIMSAWLTRVPRRIYLVRGLRLEGLHGLKRFVGKVLERTAARLATEVICVSPSLREQFIQLHLAPEGDVSVLGAGGSNGVDCSHFRPPSQDERKQARSALAIPDEAFVVGFAGRLTPDKGIEDLFSAMKLVLAKNGSAILAIAGSPDQSSPLTEQTLSQLNEPWVAHLGAVGDMLKFYWALDAFCLPSHREGLPNVNLEAAATALPVVTTHATGCRDSVVDQKTGWLVSVGNPFEVADRILELSRKPYLASHFGLEGREWVSSQFDREKVWSNYLELLRHTPVLPLFPERT